MKTLSTLLCGLVASSALAAERLEDRVFGTTPDGTTVRQFILRNDNGMVVKVMSYGATLTAIEVPDRDGKTVNVIQGSEKLEDYFRGFPAASVIGRFANRIKGATFTIDGETFEVTKNNGPNHIHGGQKNFARVVWDAEALPLKDDAVGVKLTYVSPDGEEGFPGTLTTTVTYILTGDNAVRVHYSAATDKPTAVNLTNHAYFDLSGGNGYGNQELWLNCDSYTVADAQLIPTGEIALVKGTPLDFSEYTAIGARMDQITSPVKGFYDHNYVINWGGGGTVLAARVRDPESGRVMEVHTDQPGVQLYTGNRRGFCLETQHYPDAINQPEFPSPMVRPDKPFETTTVFRFSAE